MYALITYGDFMKARVLTLALMFLFTGMSGLKAGVFDDRFPSAKVMGMGGSGVATSTGVWASYYNPAALSQVQNIAVGSAYHRLFNQAFLKNYFGAGVYPLPQKYGALSLSVQYFGVEYENVKQSSEITVGLSHGFYLLNDIHSSLAFGYSIKAYNWDLANSVEGLELGSTTVMGIDVGFQASVYSRTFIGVYFLNINAPQVGEFTKHDLPQRLTAGISYQPYDGVTTSLDFNRVLGTQETEVWAGSEFQVLKFIYLRFGGTTNPNRFSFGLGIHVEKFDVDYGLRTHSELGETHLIGLSYQL